MSHEQTQTSEGPCGPGAGADRRTITLAATAAILACLVVLHVIGVLGPTASAEMAAVRGGYSAMTTDIGTQEALFVIDDATQQLLVYAVRSNREVELLSRESLPELFVRAAANSRQRP